MPDPGLPGLESEPVVRAYEVGPGLQGSPIENNGCSDFCDAT